MINELAAGAGGVLVVGDLKVPGLAARAWYPSMFDTPALTAWVRAVADPARLAVAFHQHGIGTVLFNPGGAVYLRTQFGHFTWSRRERRLLTSFWSHRLELMRTFPETGQGAVEVYRLRPHHGNSRHLLLPGDGA
jgi:hypothetical protein